MISQETIDRLRTLAIANWAKYGAKPIRGDLGVSTSGDVVRLAEFLPVEGPKYRCCAWGAMLLGQNSIIEVAMKTLGVTHSFVCGLVDGFDGRDREHRVSNDRFFTGVMNWIEWDQGHALGTSLATEVL